MKKKYYKERLEKQLSQIINETLLFKMQDQRFQQAIVNATRVEINQERSTATVFISVLQEEKKNKIIKLLYNSKLFFMQAIRKKLRIKNYPALRFVLDNGEKDGQNTNNVLDLIERLSEEKNK